MGVTQQIIEALQAVGMTASLDGVVVAAGPDMTNPQQMLNVNKESAAYQKVALSLMQNPGGAELVRELNKLFSSLHTSSPVLVTATKPKSQVLAVPYFTLLVESKDTQLQARVLVSNGTSANNRAVALVIGKAPIRGFKTKMIYPLKPTAQGFWRQPIGTIAQDIFTVVGPKIAKLLPRNNEPTTQTQENTVTDKTDEQQAKASEDFQLEWNPENVPGSSEGASPDVMDYEDAYEDFLEKLNDLIESTFGDTEELKLKAVVVAGHGDKDRSKVDIITGHKGQDLIDTFFPSGDKVMRFSATDSILHASVTVKGKETDEFEFTAASDEEVTASGVALGKWEFFEKLGLKKPQTFVELGSVRPKDYAEFFAFMSKVSGNRTLAQQALQWINAGRAERLPTLQGWDIDFRGNAQTPMLLIGNGKVTYAMIFKKTEVSFAQSVGNRATPMGRWTWEDRCSRLASAAVLIYLLRTVATRVGGEHQL